VLVVSTVVGIAGVLFTMLLGRHKLDSFGYIVWRPNLYAGLVAAAALIVAAACGLIMVGMGLD
jgi:hypothetical protein